MPQVKSRVNGLIVNIPADAGGVVGRFVTKGGNELVFEPPSKRDIEAARKKDTAPVDLGKEVKETKSTKNAKDLA